MLRLLLMAGAGIVPIIYLIRWPGLGFIGLVVASLLVPFSLGTGSQTSINVSLITVLLLTGLWGLDMFIKQKQIRFLSSRPLVPLVALMAASVLSFGFGQLSWFATRGASITAQIGGLAVFLFLGMAFLVTVHQVKDLRWLEWITWTFIIISGAYIFADWIPTYGWVIQAKYQRAVQDSLFWTWLVAIASSQALFNTSLKLRWRVGLGILTLYTLYITLVVKQTWVSGWLPCLVALIVMIWISKPRLGIALTVVAAIALIINSQRTVGFVLVGDNEYSLNTRLEAWMVLLNVIMANPIFGLGPANYYWYTSIFPISGYYVTFNSHNNYMDIIAQTGLFGLACFLWFAFEIARLGLKLRFKAPAGFACAYVYGALGGLAGTLAAAMMGDWVIPFVYNVGLDGFRASVLGWMFLGGLLVVEKVTRQSETSTS